MWTKACKTEAVAEGKGLLVVLSGKSIALFKTSGGFYAIENTCPHRGGPLVEGSLSGFEVTCPWHAWRFDVRNGECLSAPGPKQVSYKVKTENDDIFVDL